MKLREKLLFFLNSYYTEFQSADEEKRKSLLLTLLQRESDAYVYNEKSLLCRTEDFLLQHSDSLFILHSH